MDTEVYVKYGVYDNKKNILFVEVLRDLYGILVASLLWYNKFLSDI